ncbi:MAG TPA: hypothetical protein VHO03_16645 [Ignavibacteriales bacterium]|nr:hypothetical protein [Ignavibacteriales bacterium]
MKPIEFEQSHIIIGKGQKEYRPLPAHISKDETTTVTSCWELTWKERLRVLLTGRFYFQQMTFNQPLQPQRPSVNNPLEEK